MINKNKSGLQIAREKKQMEPLELAALLKVNESVLKVGKQVVALFI